MQASSWVISFLKAKEGFRANAYKDTSGLDTIGYGTLLDTAAERAKFLFNPITETEAEKLLLRDIQVAVNGLTRNVSVTLNQNEFDALVSFVYNVGEKQFKTSTLLRLLNANVERETVAKQFARWIYSGGKVTAGLVTRREKEAEHFLGEPKKKR
jgi:lysozyme